MDERPQGRSAVQYRIRYHFDQLDTFRLRCGTRSPKKGGIVVRVATKRMTTIGLLVGISVVLTRFLGVVVPFAGIQALRIGFGQLPIMLAGVVLGPIAGAITGALADVIGGILFPIGPYFPGFTLSAAMWGMLPPLLLRLFRRESSEGSFWPTLVAVFLTSMVVSGLNTLWLSILSHKAIWALLPTRLVASMLQAPLHALLLHYSVKGYEAYKNVAVREAR
ncbi:MAG: folate family ECF transporter S component [Firmicutes bacterium]|nr:folate family ECF transporter S component [Bacillota bacterium]